MNLFKRRNLQYELNVKYGFDMPNSDYISKELKKRKKRIYVNALKAVGMYSFWASFIFSFAAFFEKFGLTVSYVKATTIFVSLSVITFSSVTTGSYFLITKNFDAKATPIEIEEKEIKIETSKIKTNNKKVIPERSTIVLSSTNTISNSEIHNTAKAYIKKYFSKINGQPNIVDSKGQNINSNYIIKWGLVKKEHSYVIDINFINRKTKKYKVKTREFKNKHELKKFIKYMAEYLSNVQI